MSNKDDFRQECKTQLKQDLSTNKITKNFLINKYIYLSIKFFNPKSVLAYIPLPIEPNINKIIRKERTKRIILLPFMLEKSLKVIQYKSPLIKKNFGVYEPKNLNMYKKGIDLAIVPIIGYDIKLARIGFGKGFYDRLFENLKKRPIVIFVQIKDCKSNSVISDKYDVLADIIITPKKIVVRKKFLNDRVRNNSYNFRNFMRRHRICNSQKD